MKWYNNIESFIINIYFLYNAPILKFYFYLKFILFYILSIANGKKWNRKLGFYTRWSLKN